MSLLHVIRSGVSIANKVTRPLQPSVTYQRCTGTDVKGRRTYAAATTLHALVDEKQRQVRTKEGILTACSATITLLDIAEISAATGGEGIADIDKFTLSDGKTGPILALGGFVDAGTGAGFYTEVSIA